MENQRKNKLSYYRVIIFSPGLQACSTPLRGGPDQVERACNIRATLPRNVCGKYGFMFDCEVLTGEIAPPRDAATWTKRTCKVARAIRRANSLSYKFSPRHIHPPCPLFHVCSSSISECHLHMQREPHNSRMTRRGRRCWFEARGMSNVRRSTPDSRW